MWHLQSAMCFAWPIAQAFGGHPGKLGMVPFDQWISVGSAYRADCHQITWNNYAGTRSRWNCNAVRSIWMRQDNAIKVLGELSDESAPNTLMACSPRKVVPANDLRS